MEKTSKIVTDIKRHIAENPEMMEVIKSVLLEMYLQGKVKTTDDMDKAVTDALIAVIYNSCPEGEKMIDDEVWETLQERNV